MHSIIHSWTTKNVQVMSIMMTRVANPCLTSTPRSMNAGVRWDAVYLTFSHSCAFTTIESSKARFCRSVLKTAFKWLKLTYFTIWIFALKILHFSAPSWSLGPQCRRARAHRRAVERAHLPRGHWLRALAQHARPRRRSRSARRWASCCGQRWQ